MPEDTSRIAIGLSPIPATYDKSSVFTVQLDLLALDSGTSRRFAYADTNCSKAVATQDIRRQLNHSQPNDDSSMVNQPGTTVIGTGLRGLAPNVVAADSVHLVAPRLV
ncbi:MAG TPA: hypothetical protein VED84_07930 [Acidimicrobiales bacterium]|nr:hypothetical protein [Acidimicrobiales bacterium]